jgi:hypothetical protein
MEKDDQIVTFETYYDPMLAEIIRAKLEANGISCFLTDDSLGIMMPVYDSTVGGIKLKVFASDVEKCREILAEEIDPQAGEDQ